MHFKNKLFILLLIVTLAVAACSRSPEESADAPTEAAPAPTAEPTAEPTEAPTEVPTEPPTEEPEPTAEPEAEEAEEPEEEPAAERVGILRFRDDGDVRSGAFELLLDGIEPAPDGSHYELWLLDESFNSLNLGPFEIAGSGTYTGAVDAHLLGTYSSAVISLEPDDVDDGEIGPIAYEGVVPAGSLVHVRHVNFQFEQNPEQIGFLLGAQEQAQLAQEHTGFLQEELAAGNLEEAQRHAEHVVNILDGENGNTFGDLDGDGVPQNPGDGFGVRGYLNGAKQHAQLAADADDATNEVQLHSEHVVISSDNAVAWLDAAIEEAVRVISSDTVDSAQPVADQLNTLIETMVQGEDTNGDGAVAPIPGEGGILTAYEHAFNMGAFEFFPAGEQAASAPAATEAAPDEGQEPEEEEEEAAEEVVVDMLNFAYEPAELTVPAGTTVTFVNQDDAPHSATLGDGSQDTGLFDLGEEGTLTFDTPGEYIVYCTLHGTPDGGGMAMTVTVE